MLDGLIAALAEMRDVVAEGDGDALLDACSSGPARARANLPSRVAGVGDLAEVRIPVPDRPGVLAEVTTLAAELDVNIADLEIAHSSEGDQGVLILLVEAANADRLRGGLMAQGYRPSVQPLGVSGARSPIQPLDGGPPDVDVSTCPARRASRTARSCAPRWPTARARSRGVLFADDTEAMVDVAAAPRRAARHRPWPRGRRRPRHRWRDRR